ncbi:MAG: serpin family protein [Clostridiales bacterium]|nr:serpin family protein [Clostridiales bacterium]
MKKVIATLLSISMLIALPCGCTKKSGKTKRSSKPTKRSEEPGNASNSAIFKIDPAEAAKYSEEELKKMYSQFVFGVMAICAKNANGRNVMISPDSILFALEMAAAGASGDTLDQMLQTLLPGADNPTAFQFAVERMNNLQGESLSIANSAWINENLADSVYEDYLEYVQKHFDAEIRTLPFNKAAVKTINDWVEDKTNGKIHDLISEVNNDDLMVLINAIAFNGQWKLGYAEEDILDHVFTTTNGDEQEATFLYSREGTYLYSESATGFLKPYADEQYGFVVILPDDPTIDINEYIANLSPEEYWEFWNNRTANKEVYAMMPEFRSEYSVTLNDILCNMGMDLPFSINKSDFSNLCKERVYISQAVHKTYIDVNRNGTEAAAATALTMTCGASIGEEQHTFYVTCDRPYAYAIVDLQTGLPVFLGTVESVK